MKQRMINRLRARADQLGCSEYLATLEPLFRYNVMIQLMFDRLGRKMKMIDELYAESDQNWNQTFYLLYFRTLGDSKNQQAYLELARRVPYRIVLRERQTRYGIESMLLGASGLLDGYAEDEHTRHLRDSFAHLSAKYEITPLSIENWNLGTIRPVNHPILRLAEAAKFFEQDEFLMDRIMQCRSQEDVRKLFCVDAPEYWLTHFVPGAPTNERPKRIGNTKADIIGINLVAVLQFAYGTYMNKDSLRDNALSLLENITAEDNRFIRAWYTAGGLRAKTALESQALLQLATQYCTEKRCEECPVGRRILKNVEKNC